MKTITTAFFLLILTGFILAISGCKDGDRRRDRDRDDYRPPVTEEPSTPLPPPPVDFRSTTGRNVVESPNDTFSIPACGRGKLGYVVTKWTQPLRATGTIRLTFTYTQSPDAIVVDAEDLRSTPGNMALFFQRDNDDYSQEKYDRGYRQWSLPRQLLTPGDHVFEVQLVPASWNFGHSGFSQALLDPEHVGFTLAGLGGPSAGHGICMKQGTASITVTGLTVD